MEKEMVTMMMTWEDNNKEKKGPNWADWGDSIGKNNGRECGKLRN